VTTGLSRINSQANSHFADNESCDPKNSTILKFDFFASGKGYYAQTVPIILALVVLVTYCVFSLSYVVYSVVSGVSSNSWDTIAEITALALNSKRPDYLGYTSAGL